MQSELQIVGVGLFKKVFQCLAKFIEKVHCDIDKDGMRIRSIDPHDFCYVDMIFTKNFFNGELPTERLSFGLDVSRLSKILSYVIDADRILMRINKEDIEFLIMKKWKMIFKVNYLSENPYNLPEPKNISYDASFEVPPDEFIEIIDASSAVSSELVFNLHGDDFQIQAFSSSRDHCFYAEPLGKLEVWGKSSQPISIYAIINYLKALSALIKECKDVRIWLGNEKPLKIDLIYPDKGVFTIYLSPKCGQIRPKQEKRSTSLPRVVVTKFPDFLTYLANCPRGENFMTLKLISLETSGGDYTRLGRLLDLVKREGRKIMLTKKGEQFVSLYRKNVTHAKKLLHKNALSKIKPYKLLIKCLKKRPMSPDDLFYEINSMLAERKEKKIDRQDLSTLLGLATWCGIIDRKLALYYFSKPQAVKGE
jgi:hypothetical protein